jgi:molybdopterin/thiamine biosynthesis adenylyltransferase
MSVVITEEVLSKAQLPQHTRFSELPWYDPMFGPQWITVGGAGGIGSWLSAVLSRAGYALHIWDPDIIDDTNFGGQLYTREYNGKQKSEAVVELCRSLGAQQTLAGDGRFEKGAVVSPICFSAFDNMNARKALFETWVETIQSLSPDEKKASIFIDGRMLAEAGHIYWVTPDKIEQYRTQLFDDKEVQDQPCSAKATSHCGAFISSLMMAGFTNWVTNVKLDVDAREVPFKFEFELPLLNFNFKTAEQCIPL